MPGMTDARRRVALAADAVTTLEELLPLTASDIVRRDAAIQRFEYSVEATWKAGQAVLDASEGIVVASPKGVIRACHEVGWLTDDQADRLFDAVEDRNMTSHTYNRGVAELLAGKLPGHAQVLREWVVGLRRVVGVGS